MSDLTGAVMLGGLSATMFLVAPAVLTRCRWMSSAPRTGVLLWQAVGFAGAIAAVGAGLSIAVAPLHASPLNGVKELVAQGLSGHPLADLGLYEALGLTLATDVSVVLAAGLATTLIRTTRARSRHRALLDLIAESRETAPGALILAHPMPAAYCLPGLRPRIVLSDGALGLLDEYEVSAVLAHERGHVQGHHGLAMLPFASMVDLLRWLPYVRRAPASVAGLLEMAADDFAGRQHGRRVVARALARMSSASAFTAPTCSFGVLGVSTAERIDRLVAPERRWGRWVLLGWAASAVALAAPVAALLVPLALPR